MTFGQRVVGVLKLDPHTFEEIEADESATGQALGVVLGASIASGVGAGIIFGPIALVRSALAALAAWVIWALLTYWIGTRVLPEPQTHATIGQLLRVIGFAYAPSFFAFFTFIPILGALVALIVALWLLATTVVGVRQALDYRSTARALGVVVIGWVIVVILQVIF